MKNYNSKNPQHRIIAALEFRREQYNWSMKKMAAELCVGYTHYTEIINGKRRLSLQGRINAAKIGVPPKTLLEII